MISELTTTTSNDAFILSSKGSGVSLLSMPLTATGACNSDASVAVRVEECTQPERVYRHMIIMVLAVVVLSQWFFGVGYLRCPPWIAWALIVAVVTACLIYIHLLPSIERSLKHRKVQWWTPPIFIFLALWVAVVEDLLPRCVLNRTTLALWGTRTAALLLFVIASLLTVRGVREGEGIAITCEAM